MENFLWKNPGNILSSHPLWKNAKILTLACGRKILGALRKMGVFHINLHYHCYYYLKSFIDIFIYLI